MHPTYARSCGVRTLALLGTASFLTMAATAPAQAQVAEILITGSLIEGAAAVGVPVTQLGQESFLETGAITVSDVLNQVQEVQVLTSQTNTGGGGNAQRLQEVSIRGIATGAGTETLLMVNGMRVPIQSFSAELIDPSIIAPIAVQRVDVLAEGASATYGSDAVAGVINVILRRGYEGMLTQATYGFSEGLGADTYTIAGLYGRQWDTGGITVSLQWRTQKEVRGDRGDKDFGGFWNLDFERFGFDDKTPLGTAAPAVVHVGGRETIEALDDLGFRSNDGTRACANCFSVPQGVGWDYGTQAPGPTTTWSAVESNPGVLNLHNPLEIADMIPHERHTHAHFTFDQIIADDLFGIFTDVNLFADGFYSKRDAGYVNNAGASPGRENLKENIRLPDDYIYLPTDAPSGLRANYNFAFERPPQTIAGDTTYRYAAGLEAEMPFDWDSRLYYARTYVKNFLRTNGMINENHVIAAVGGTVKAGSNPGEGEYTKPDDVPLLNVFCDATVYMCNSRATLDYIAGYRERVQWYDINEMGLQFNGPIFELPGGPVEVALLGNRIAHSYFRFDNFTYDEHTTRSLRHIRSPFGYHVYAATGQINIPLIGPGMEVPLVESLVIEGGYRYDNYQGDVEAKVWTPKLSARWDTGTGLSFRGAWGKAFRAPGVAEAAATGAQIQALNSPGAQDDLPIGCAAIDSLGLDAGVANPGGLDAILNPDCLAGLELPGGLVASGSAGGASPVRGGFALDPEDAVSWSVGFSYAPLEGFLAGLNIDFTYWSLKINGLLDDRGSDLDRTNDPRNIVCTVPAPDCTFLVAANPFLPNTDPVNAVFRSVVDELVASPAAQVNIEQADAAVFIEDSAITNIGFRKFTGIDFASRYDFELGNLGAFHVGWRGTYDLTEADPGGSAFAGNTGGRFPWRARAGWAQGAEGFYTTLFLNHLPGNAPNSDSPPDCYWASGFSAGSCYAGSPYSPHGDIFDTSHPGLYVWDLNLGYNTGTGPMNPYLQGINFTVNIRNLLDQRPPFNYEVSSNRGETFWDGTISPLQRYFTFTVSKEW